MNSNFCRRRYSCLAIALTTAAIAAPAAQAHHAPGEGPGATAPRQSLPGAASQGDSPTQWNASPLEIDRLGPKYVPLHYPQSAAPVDENRPGPTAAGTAIANARHDAMPVSVVKVVRPSGFDRGDAGIGAGVASLTIALVALLALLLTRRSQRTIASQRSQLTGTWGTEMRVMNKLFVAAATVGLLLVSSAETRQPRAAVTNGWAGYVVRTDARSFVEVAGSGGALEHPTSARSHSQVITGLKGHILFTRAGGPYGDETVFAANADGSGQRRISAFGCCGSPWAMRNGSRIVFGGRAPDGRFTAVTAKLDGTHRVLLPLPKGTLNLGDGPLSPDGKRLVREGFDEGHHASDGIYITRASDGANLRRVTKHHFIPGDFSPNGKQLVLFRGPEGEPPPPGALWIVNANGRGLRRLTRSNVKVACCNNYRWSPDGKKILFADFDGVIWTIAPDGSKRTKVLKDDNGRFAVTPTWSPDGSMIMFALDPTPNQFEHPLNGLYVIQADGSDLTQVIGGNDFKREPVWVSR